MPLLNSLSSSLLNSLCSPLLFLLSSHNLFPKYLFSLPVKPDFLEGREHEEEEHEHEEHERKEVVHNLQVVSCRWQTKLKVELDVL